MNDQYQYSGERLTTKMARELIVELFKGQTVPKVEIVRKVDEIHLGRGGKKAETKVHPVTNALNALKRKGIANNDPPGIGIWHIINKDEPIEEDEVKRVGSGNSSVYLYYYPTYRQFAELRGEKTWPCKIGCSEYSDPIHRIHEQTGTGMPEQPKVALVMQTNRPKKMEKAIHKFLDRVPNAPGTEWFGTNPGEVEDIYNWDFSQLFGSCKK